MASLLEDLLVVEAWACKQMITPLLYDESPLVDGWEELVSPEQGWKSNSPFLAPSVKVSQLSMLTTKRALWNLWGDVATSYAEAPAPVT